MFTIAKIIRRIKQFFYAKYAQRAFNLKHSDLVAKGPMRIINEGSTTFGTGILFDSSSESRIRVFIGRSGKLEIGSQVYINEGVRIVCNESIKIGEKTIIAPEVIIMDDDYHLLDPNNRHEYVESMVTRSPINIGKNVWICSRTIITKGISIGDNSVIAAGSIVTHDIPNNVLVGGNPAKIIKSII